MMDAFALKPTLLWEGTANKNWTQSLAFPFSCRHPGNFPMFTPCVLRGVTLWCYKGRLETATIHSFISAICTMKIIIFCLAVTAAHADVSTVECTLAALKNIPEALTTLEKLACGYTSINDPQTAENYRQTFRDLRKILDEAGTCNVDALLGTKGSLEEILNQTGDNLQQAGDEFLLELLDKVGLSRTGTGLACAVLPKPPGPI